MTLFSVGTYRLCWLLVLGIHILVVSYYSMMSWFYAFLPGSYLDQTFTNAQIGLGTGNGHRVLLDGLVQDVTAGVGGPQAEMTQPASRVKPPVTATRLKRSSRLHGLVFGVWGLLVVVLHLHAKSLVVAPNCLLQVRPSGITRPACALVYTHCVNAGIIGSAAELQDAWEIVEPSVVLHLIIRHCPALEMPPYLQKFSHLVGFKMYNCTIVQWDADAEFNAKSHAYLKYSQMIRIHTPKGDLPKGLQSHTFPPLLLDLEFCITSIARLPEDLDKSWHEASTIYMEGSQLGTFPDALVKLKARHLALGGNPFASVPAGAFECPNLVYITLGGTQITELPENVTLTSDTLRWVMVPNTKISYWYKWLDDLYGRSDYYSVYAYATPYCTELDEIRAGNRSSFSVTTSPSSPDAKLSNSLMGNVTLADWYAYCGPAPDILYTWETEDTKYGLTN